MNSHVKSCMYFVNAISFCITMYVLLILVAEYLYLSVYVILGQVEIFLKSNFVEKRVLFGLP